MKRIVEIDGRRQEIEWSAAGAEVEFTFEGARRRAGVMLVEPGVYSVLVDGRGYEVKVSGRAVALHGERMLVDVIDPRSLLRRGGSAASSGRQQIKAPMPGKVVRLLVAEGDSVAAGHGVAVVEAMKMQNEMKASKAGTVRVVRVAAGATVGAGDVLLEIE